MQQELGDPAPLTCKTGSSLPALCPIRTSCSAEQTPLRTHSVYVSISPISPSPFHSPGHPSCLPGSTECLGRRLKLGLGVLPRCCVCVCVSRLSQGAGQALAKATTFLTLSLTARPGARRADLLSRDALALCAEREARSLVAHTPLLGREGSQLQKFLQMFSLKQQLRRK